MRWIREPVCRVTLQETLDLLFDSRPPCEPNLLDPNPVNIVRIWVKCTRSVMVSLIYDIVR